MPKKDLPFDIVGGSPIKLLTTINGKKYQVRVTLAVVALYEAGGEPVGDAPNVEVGSKIVVSVEEAE